MSSLADLKKELRSAASLKDTAERGVTIAAIVAEALRTIDQDPVLVGGAAVEFYTQGGYSTADIDMVSEGGADLISVMNQLGFEKIGKDFLQKNLNICMEFPSSRLKPSERVDILKVGGRMLRIISIEDLIIDRLCAYKFWRSALDGVNASLLLELGDADEMRVESRAKEEDVADALAVVRRIKEEVIRRKLSRKEADKLIQEGIRGLQSR